MHRLFVLITLLQLAAAASPPIYNIDLDLAEEERWGQVCAAFQPKILEMYNMVSQAVDADGLGFFWEDAGEALGWMPYAGEIRGLADCVGAHPNITAGVNFIDVLVSKMSLVTSLPWNGVGAVASGPNYVFHSMNFESNKFQDTSLLRELTIDVRFIRNGRMVYRGTTVAGMVSLYTGQGDFFASHVSNRPRGSILNNINALTSGGHPLGVATRVAFESSNITDLSTAVDFFSETPLATNGYFIVSGVTQEEGGVVVTRGYTDQAGVPLYKIGVPIVVGGVENPSSWYCVETNYDLGEQPPYNDDRREILVKDLNAVGSSQLTFNGLQSILQGDDLLLQNSVFTTTMSAAQSAYHTEISEVVPITPTPPSSSSSNQTATFLIILFVGLVVAGIVYILSQKHHREKITALREKLKREKEANIGTEAQTYSTFGAENVNDDEAKPGAAPPALSTV